MSPVGIAQWSIRGAIAAFVVILLAVAIDRFAGWNIPFHVLLGSLLLAFALLKFSVGTEAWLRQRNDVAPAPEVVHGSRKMVFGWIIYKYIAGTVALAAAIYVLTAGAAKVDRVFG